MYSKAFISLISANMFFWMSVNFFLPVLPLYYHSLGMDDHQVGLAVGAYSVGAVLFRVYSGRAVDRYGSKPVITVGVVLSVIAILGYHFSNNLFSATLARFLHGAAISGYSSAALTMVTLMTEERYHTQAVAVYTLFTMFGMGFSASTANWLYGWGNMPVIIVCGVAATILSLILFPSQPKLNINSAAGKSQPFRKVAANPGVMIPAMNLMAVNICYGSIMTFLPLLMLSYGIAQLSPFYIAYSIAVIFTRVWVGKLCIWLTPERLALYLMVLIGGTMLMAGSFVSSWVMVLCGASIGVAFGLAFPTMATTVTANTEPASRGTAFGLYTMSVDIGFAIGAIAMGAVATIWGYQSVFIVAGVYTILYCILYRCWLLDKLCRNNLQDPSSQTNA